MVWDPLTAKAASQLEVFQCLTARWVKSSVTQMLIDLSWWELVQRRTDARLAQMFKIVHNLVLIEEVIKYVKLQRNFVNLQQILANKKYYDMSFFPCTVKDWNSLPKTLLVTDSLKSFKSGVVNNEHHSSY